MELLAFVDDRTAIRCRGPAALQGALQESGGMFLKKASSTASVHGGPGVWAGVVQDLLGGGLWAELAPLKRPFSDKGYLDIQLTLGTCLAFQSGNQRCEADRLGRNPWLGEGSSCKFRFVSLKVK